jgi:amino-acid N-acetyltransferase
MSPAISLATPPDLPAVFDLLDRSRLPRAGLAEHVGSTLVARDQVGIVGTAALEVYGDCALLRSVAVAPERRGQGMGHAVTTAALDLARRRGLRAIYLLTETAADFFPKYGFRPVPRSAVAPAVLASTEFTTACPDSALAMVRTL